ncbi:MAG: acyl-CoA thioesterase II [Flavobacteriaceae bacterium]|nr:acyl-CoA thioesterase II [Flavobacteriaceae bacterium]|tara:strand:+ start:188204 stop:189070 length:867 start_codon:yes stop_codon:yes gene_type:complete
MINSQQLIDLLKLDVIDESTFKGYSVTIGSPNVFGGQVLAQALHAATNTVPEEREVHSLHSYFLEAGNLEKPIIYHVANLRNGGSFSTRRVTAKQDDKVIFIMAASFHRSEEGFEHQIEMPANLSQPEDLNSWEEMAEKFGEFIPDSMKYFLTLDRPISFKPVYPKNPLQPKNLPPTEFVWFKLKGEIPSMTNQLKQQILTYISDYNVLNAAFNPNAKDYSFGNTRTASLDHSMWFYRDFDFDDWMLFSAESPSTFGARGFVRGNIFTRKGVLIASFAQEGLMRPRKK